MKICHWLFLDFLRLQRLALLPAMVGTAGCSGGRRPGAGRRPGTTQIKSKPKSKGIKKGSKKDGGPPDASNQKLTAFFSSATLPTASGHRHNKIVRASHSLTGPTVHVCMSLSCSTLSPFQLASLELTPYATVMASQFLA